MKRILKTLAITSCIPTLLFATSLSSCSKTQAEMGGIIGLDKLEIGKTTTYAVNIFPQTLDQTIVWSCNDESIATIDANTGELSGIKEGTVVITATSPTLNISASKTIEIVENTTLYVEISGEDSVSLYSPDLHQYVAKITPESTISEKFSWEIDDTSIADFDWSHTGDNFATIIPKNTGRIRLTAKLNEDASLVGFKYINITPPVVKSWEEDDWKTIMFYSNQGLSSLAEVYRDEYERENITTGKIKNSFIGSTKKVTFDSRTHDVMVIGQEHDIDADTCLPTTLTFQFAEVLTQSNYTALKKEYNDGGIWYHTYQNSWYVDETWYCKLRSYFCQTFTDKLNDYFGAPIKNVQKKTLLGNKTTDLVTSTDTVFVPALAEIYSLDAIKNSNFEWWNHSISEDVDYYEQEGRQYEFYQNTIANNLPESTYESTATGNYYIDTRKSVVTPFSQNLGVCEKYWLRSPFIDVGVEGHDDSFLTFVINGDTGGRGAINTELAQSERTCSFTPCFCI